MNVTQGQILLRGVTNCCPNCGNKTLFRPGSAFTLDDQCRSCGLKFEKDEGFFLGAMSLNYGITLVAFLAPIALTWYYGGLGKRTAVALAISVSVVVPIALYRSSRSWQLMLYYFFFPQHLPANHGVLKDEDENI